MVDLAMPAFIGPGTSPETDKGDIHHAAHSLTRHGAITFGCGRPRSRGLQLAEGAMHAPDCIATLRKNVGCLDLMKVLTHTRTTPYNGTEQDLLRLSPREPVLLLTTTTLPARCMSPATTPPRDSVFHGVRCFVPRVAAAGAHRFRRCTLASDVRSDPHSPTGYAAPRRGAADRSRAGRRAATSAEVAADRRKGTSIHRGEIGPAMKPQEVRFVAGDG